MNPGYLISCDPGVTSGICIMEYVGGIDYHVVESFLIPWDSRYQMMQDLYRFTPITTLIYEKFRLYPSKEESQAYSEFEPVQTAEIFCTFAWINKLDHLLVPLPASVKGSGKTGKVSVQIRPQDASKLNRKAYDFDDWQHILDSYQLARYLIVQQLSQQRKASA
jgi:hypothetical protein